METYVQEPLKLRDEKEKKEHDAAVDTLERDLAAFVGTYLKEIALSLSESQMDELSVGMDDISLRMVKKHKPQSGIMMEGGAGGAGAEKAVKPIISHYLGIFHLLNQKQVPLVKVGDQVRKGQVLARIETMNITNEVKAARDGIIVEILEEDGKPVEYGQMLFLLELL